MPTRQLPEEPSLEHLRKQAKRLRRGVSAGDAESLALVKEFHPHAERAIGVFTLADAQLTIARSYRFPSWARMKEHLALIAPYVWNTPRLPVSPPPADVFIRLACLIYGDWHRANPDRARRLLADHPDVQKTSIYTASAAGDVDAARSFIDRDPALINAKGGPLNWEPLLYACYSRMDGTTSDWSTVEVARLLLARGADPNAGFLWGANYLFTALTGAFGEGEDNMNQLPHPHCLALATLLLDAGADPNDSQTLYNRHFKPNDDHLKLLLSYGLGKNPGGPWYTRLAAVSTTPSQLLTEELATAVGKHFVRRVELLVEHGVDVNTPSLRSGRTPYEIALRNGDRAMTTYLEEHGAKKVELDPLETFAIACIAGRRDEVRARLAEDPSLLDRLDAHGRVSLIHRAAQTRRHDSIRLVLDLGIDINSMERGTGYDRTPLHNAAAFGDLDTVKFLIGLGADQQLRDFTFGGTAMGWARYGQQHEVIRYLMPQATLWDAVQCDGVERAEAILRETPSAANAPDPNGYSAAFYLHPELTRLDEMIRVLIAHGLDLNTRGPDGIGPLDRAIARGWTEFADRLRTYGAKTTAELGH
jgi:ankyrin repeat protein